MPDPFVVPDSFWEEVATSLWRNAPRVWRQPFDVPYATEEDAFRALCGLTARLDAGETDIQPRVYVGDKPAAFSYDRHAARPDDGGFAGYEARLFAGLRGRELGMVIADSVALDDVLWRRALAFLRGLHAAVGTPPGGSHAEIFLGNYQRSFFGVHKDRLETFTFVVRGRKRFLAWPYEVLLEAGAVPPDAPLHAFSFDEFDIDAWRDRAVVLEGGPGDVMFWPASWWHVPEAADEGFVTTLTLACAPSTMLQAGAPLRIAQAGFEEAGRDAYYTEDPTFPVVRGPADARAGVAAVESALERVLADPVFAKARRAAALQWLSAMGFKRGPERLPLPELTPEDRLEAIAPILYDEVDEDGFACAASGILLQSLPAFLPLIERVNGGGIFTVGELVAELAGGDGQPTAEDLVEALCHLTAARALLRL